MILSDGTLLRMLDQFLRPSGPELVNPASVDIRIGNTMLVQKPQTDVWEPIGLGMPARVDPGELVLVETLECLMVPNGFAVELKLKSTAARQGWNHSLAFWFDPGWEGIGTMELQNISKTPLLLETGRRIAQIIVHRLDTDAIHPYNGRYQKATGVESAKS